MEYSLAKELKDAGFPQEADRLEKRGFPDIAHALRFCQTEEDVYYSPLSVLIEACGDKLGTIHRHLDNTGWTVNGTSKIITTVMIEDLHFSATTLEGALSRLWLALNKK